MHNKCSKKAQQEFPLWKIHQDCFMKLQNIIGCACVGDAINDCVDWIEGYRARQKEAQYILSELDDIVNGRKGNKINGLKTRKRTVR